MRRWTSLTSSPRRGSFCLSSLDPTQLSRFCQKHSTEAHVCLSALIRPGLAGGLQALSHMGLQNLKAEVDPSLEPGSDHRASENLQGCSRLGNTWRLSCTSRPRAPTNSSVVHREPSWSTCLRTTTVSAKDCTGSCSVSSSCLLSALIPWGSKDCTQRLDNEKPPQITAHVVCNQSPVQF